MIIRLNYLRIRYLADGRAELVRRYYNNPLAGYFGATKTYKLLTYKYY